MPASSQHRRRARSSPAAVMFVAWRRHELREAREIREHHAMGVRLRPHPALAVLPPLTTTELEVAVERVRLYGQTVPIEVLASGEIVAGIEEYEACRAANITPKVTRVADPPDVVEYVLRRLPRNLTSLDRAVIAVLAEEQWKTLGRERMRRGGENSGRRRSGSECPTFTTVEAARWYEHAARIVGTTAGAVRRVAQLRRSAPDVFEALRNRKLVVLKDARDLAQALPTAKSRAKALRLKAKHPRLPFSRLVADVMRAERPAIACDDVVEHGQRWTVFEGDLTDRGREVADATIDMVFADVVYGDAVMADAVGRLAARVLVPGGVLAVIAGHEVSRSLQALTRHLTPIAVGSYLMRGNGNAKWAAPVTRFDALPVLIFGKGKPRPIAHLAFESVQKDHDWHGWGKNVAAMQDIIESCVGSGARVFDPCCGGGSTGEAALRLGCEFIGIDVDAKAVLATRRRLAGVEQELRNSKPASTRRLRAG